MHAHFLLSGALCWANRCPAESPSIIACNVCISKYQYRLNTQHPLNARGHVLSEEVLFQATHNHHMGCKPGIFMQHSIRCSRLMQSQTQQLLSSMNIPVTKHRKFCFRFRLPQSLPPSFRGHAIRYSYYVWLCVIWKAACSAPRSLSFFERRPIRLQSHSSLP